ncbi:hypothetical protein FDP41_013453 [Naegleria fowleri]|uniref:BZIP domain-containing protein n=1 Tax=Naegleria fowleri TaxID=5763 RepID=A0A6A5C4I5_NAEFO|nr:uncharacterized protein FDP41_013453 [Naegleria fowleri]KAF0980239.1 hypothetical protein FDP41_013453 [Naegleria fowleri]CAG4712719.1 unnamed protein product [Naegleria fowleri]
MASTNNNFEDDGCWFEFLNESSDSVLNLEQGSAPYTDETTTTQASSMADPNNMYLTNSFQIQQPQQQQQFATVDFGALPPTAYALLPNYFMHAMIPQTTVASMFPVCGTLLANSNAFSSPTNSLSPNSSIDSIPLANTSLLNVDTDKPIILLPTSSSLESVDSNSTSSSACQTDKNEPPKKKKKVTTRKKATNKTDHSSGSDSEESKRKKAHRRKQEEIEDDMKRLQDLDQQTELTAEQKEEKKKLRNRYTAKVSRDRKKKELEDLRNENENLRKERDSLKKQCEEHVQTVNRLNLELNRLAQIVNSQVRPSRTALKSLIVFIGVFVFIGLLAFLSGSYKFSSTMKSTISDQRIAARRVARGLLTINNTSTESNQPNTNPSSKSVREVVNTTPPKEYQQHQEQFSNYPLHEPVYVENTMEMGEMLDEFNGDGMYTYDVFYPTKIKRHFREFQSFNGQKHNISETAHIRSYENNSTSPIGAIRKPSKPKSVTSQRHNNSKQITSFVSPSSLSKHMEEKKHKYEKAKVYVPDTKGKTKVQPNELQLFCPYLYPLIAGIPDPSYEFNTKDFDNTKSSVKIHIPIQMVCNKTNTKVIRMAEINAVNITLSEIYYEFNGGALTEVQPQTRVASADV